MPQLLKPVKAATLAIGLTMCATTALACAFHSYVPDETVVDKMLGSDHIVLARPDPHNPTRFKAVDALRGGTEGVELPQQLDEDTFKKMSSNPDDLALFARQDSYGPWEQLAYLDADFHAVILQVSAQLDRWEFGGDEERFQLFADLHNHPNPDLHRLALQELDRAPYDLLRTLRLNADATAIISALSDPEFAKFLPIHVLLLGFSDSADGELALQNGLSNAVMDETDLLAGAWATALIELTGVRGVQDVAQTLLSNPDMPSEKQESLIEAFAIHAQSDSPKIVAEIDRQLARILDTTASTAGMVARQFGARGDWSQAERLQKMLKSGSFRNAGTLISVGHYLSFAQEYGEPASANN